MATVTIDLKGFTFAVDNVEDMVAFYDKVFGTDMEPFEAFNTTLYRGSLAGFSLVFCPNEILGIQASKNRQQINFRVSDIDAVIQQAEAYGGQQIMQIREEEHRRAGGIADPDRNTMELEEIRVS